MDQTHKTQNTNAGIFNNLVNEETETISEPLNADKKDIVKNYSSDQIEKQRSLSQKMLDFEQQVEMAKRDEIPWLEVDKDVLVALCKGVYPESKSHTYKGVNVCEHGMSEEIEADQSQDVYNKVHVRK